MDNSGNQLLKSFHTLREFCADIAQLLVVATKGIEEHGWQHQTGTRVLQGGSNSIDEPRKWIPENACRFFQHDECPSRLVYVGIVLAQPTGGDRIDQPLITYGFFDFDEEEGIDTWWNDMATWHLKASAHQDQDQWKQFEPDQKLTGKNSRLRRGTTCAIPLVEVRSDADINDRIVQPLIEKLQKLAHA